MNLQFLTNNNPPPAQSVLQYSVSPGTVFVSTSTQPMYADLTITVFNPQSVAVTCQFLQFGFLVGAAYGDLTASAADVQSSSDQTSWTISAKAAEDPDNTALYYFRASPSTPANRQLAPQQSMVFHLKRILINEALGEGGAPIVIKEVTGANINEPVLVQGSIAVTKAKPTLSIQQLEVIPPTPINPGDKASLSWQVTGADRWQLYDYDASTLLYDSKTGKPPNALSYGPVYPQQNTNFELIAYAGQIFTMKYAPVMVMAAHFVGNPYAKPTSIEEGGKALLHWQTKFANRLTISAPDLPKITLNAQPNQYDIFPDAPGNQYAVSPMVTTTYTLTAHGPGKSRDVRQVTVAVNLPPPQIISFTVTPSLVKTKQNTVLAWETSYGKLAKLTQHIAGQSGEKDLGAVPLNPKAYPVSPVGISRYFLTVYGQGKAVGQVVAIEEVAATAVIRGPGSVLCDGTHVWVGGGWVEKMSMVRASDATLVRELSPPGYPVSLLFDGTYIWVALGIGGVLRLNPADGTPVGPEVGSMYSAHALAYDGTHVWVASFIEGTLTRINPKDGTMVGQPTKVGERPIALIFDGTFIWVANSQSGNVMKIRIQDGAVLQTIPTGNNPWSLAFDGKHVWVAVYGNEADKVLKLNPQDGAVLKTIHNARVTSLAFDGLHLWMAHMEGDSVDLLSIETETVVASFQVGDGPSAMAFDGSHMWVTNYNNGNIGTLKKL